MINFIKNQIFGFAAVVALFSFVACEADDADGGVSSSDYLLSDFVLTYSGSQYHAAIDQESGDFTLSIIEDSSLITAVSYTLRADATISPIPGEDSWASSQSYTVSAGSESKVYTLNLPNLVIDEVDPDGNGEDGSGDGGDGGDENVDPDPDPEPEVVKTDYKVVGYLPPANNAYSSRIDQIDWSNLSHVIVSFLQVNSDGSIQYSTSTLVTRMQYVMEQAAQNNFKVMIAVQSSSTSNSNFFTAINNATTRATLIDNLVTFVKDYELDGMDIDFEEYSYVGFASYSTFITELGAALDELEEERGTEVLYSVAIAPNYTTYPKTLGSMVDFINLMIYDIQAYSAVNADHASIEQFESIMEEACDKFGATKAQLIAGVPFYGYTYDNLGKLDTASTSNATQKSYSDIFNAFSSEYGADYVVANSQIGNTVYDGQEKIRTKSQYVVDNNYGGIMIWQILQDLADSNEEYKLLPVIGETLVKIEGK